MKKSFVFGLVFVLGTLSYVPQLAFSEEEGKVESLRGDHPISELSAITEWKRVPSDFQTFLPAYEQQAPLIPHFIEGYKITLEGNKCLTCHKKTLSPTHLKDRNGKVLDTVDNRLYFCTLCHVSQVDAQPLIDNTFESAND
ncbi:periplasmic nitrate reductase beta subunit [Beggiatoa sp. SS]|nr:periplasmic nitrate reductase beta subunit [Beggiatoa sp. SS]